MMLLQIAMGFAVGYMMSSWIESFMHEYVSDARPKALRRWKKYPRLLKPLINTHYSHHIIHHAKTYRRDHVTQFRSLAEKQNLLEELAKRGRHGEIIVCGAFATRLAGEGALVFISPLLIAIPLLLWLFGGPGFIAGSVAMVLPPFMSHFVHPYLHHPFKYWQENAPRWLAWFLASAYGRAVYRNHFMHHRYGGKSHFNLVLGADYLRRRVHAANKRDLKEMQSVGMPLPKGHSMREQNYE